MRPLQLKRLRFSKEADRWLRVLKARTGITPNLLCRIGFCLSLEEPGLPAWNPEGEDSQREINRYTLLGEHDTLLTALLRQRLFEDGLLDAEENMDDAFRAHMHRGVLLLAGRVKCLADLSVVLPAQAQRTA